MNYKNEYKRWLANTTGEIKEELEKLDEAAIEDAFYRDLAFGTGGLRGTLGAGTNRMNIHTVSKATQGLAEYLNKNKKEASIVIGYDSRLKSDVFARTAAFVFAANNIKVYLWPYLSPVPTVSFATRYLGASAGVMITASHNPSEYNGYKVYGSDGCQITTEAAASILTEIEKIDIFSDVKSMDFDDGVAEGKIEYISEEVMDAYIGEVRKCSVLYGDTINHDLKIIYSPLNGTGLIPVTRVLREAGFENIIVVDEQAQPDGNFPTCPYPNPEVREAMTLGLEYCEREGADLLIATDPDSDRCGIAVKDEEGYRLISGNEVGLLLLDFICSQRTKHHKMSKAPVFIKTIVTMDLAEKIADHYGVETKNVLTGFKFIGEQIGMLEAAGREDDYICGFEESYGYLTGTYVRDKDAVNASFMICEMFAYYKMRGISLLEKLEDIYNTYGYCLNTLHSYNFPGSKGMEQMGKLMKKFHEGLDSVAGDKITKTIDYLPGVDGLPSSDVLKYYFSGDDEEGSIVVRPSGTEPKLKAYISVTAEDEWKAQKTERLISDEIEELIRG